GAEVDGSKLWRDRTSLARNEYPRAIDQVAIDANLDLLVARFTRDIAVIPQLLGHVRIAGEADHDAVHGRLTWSIGVPCERAMGKLDPPALLIDRGEQGRYLLALADGVRGDIGELAGTAVVIETHCLCMAARDVVQRAAVVGSPYPAEFFALLSRLGLVADERRVAEDVGVASYSRDE